MLPEAVKLRVAWIDFKEERDLQVANFTKGKLHYNRHFPHWLEPEHAKIYKNVTDFATRKRKEEKDEKERKEREEIQAAIFRVQVMEHQQHAYAGAGVVEWSMVKANKLLRLSS